jgi:hypothetical protein
MLQWQLLLCPRAPPLPLPLLLLLLLLLWHLLVPPVPRQVVAHLAAALQHPATAAVAVAASAC